MKNIAELFLKFKINLPESNAVNITGISKENFPFFYYALSQSELIKKSTLILVPTKAIADYVMDKLKHRFDCIQFFGLDSSPYCTIIQSETNLFDRFSTLSRVSLNG